MLLGSNLTRELCWRVSIKTEAKKFGFYKDKVLVTGPNQFSAILLQRAARCAVTGVQRAGIAALQASHMLPPAKDSRTTCTQIQASSLKARR